MERRCMLEQMYRFLNLTGYMFEQSIPLRGMGIGAAFTELSNDRLLQYAMFATERMR